MTGSDRERARATAREVLEEEVGAYEARLRDRTRRYLFRADRQADLFAAVKAVAEAEKSLGAALSREARERHLADTLAGCITEADPRVHLAVRTRGGARKSVSFAGARRAARFAAAVQDAGLSWEVERSGRAEALPARLGRAAEAGEDGAARRYLLGRGIPPEVLDRLAAEARGGLRAVKEAQEEAARRSRRRWEDSVRKVVASAKSRLESPAAVAATLGRCGVREATLAVPALGQMARLACLQADGRHRLDDALGVAGWADSLPDDAERSALRRLVVVASPLDALAHYQVRGGADGEWYVSLGVRSRVRDEGGLTTVGTRLERLVLSERWRSFVAGETPGVVVCALGAGDTERVAVVRRLVGRHLGWERQTPSLGRSWAEELGKRERDLVRAHQGRALGRELGRER